jgi:hypothetical protein
MVLEYHCAHIMDCGFHDCGLQVHVYLAPKVDLADSYRGSGHGSHETLHVRACGFCQHEGFLFVRSARAPKEYASELRSGMPRLIW